MIKKLIGLQLLLLFLFLLTPIFLHAVAVENSPSQPDYFTAQNRSVGVSTTIFRIDYLGNLVPGINNTMDIGESSHAYRTAYLSTLNVSSGIVNLQQFFLDLPSADSDSYRTGTGGIRVTTTNLVVGITSTTTNFTQPVYGRNIIIFSSFTTGTDTTTVTGNAIVIGTDTTGKINRETISFSTTETSGVGNIAWTYVSSITFSATAISSATGDAFLFVGTGNRIGLNNNISAATDIYKLIEAGADVRPEAANVSINPTYETIDFATNGDGSNDYSVYYKARNSTP